MAPCCDPVERSAPANILVVAHRTAATPALLEAIRERAGRGPASFHLLVPNPFVADWHPIHTQRHEQEHLRQAADTLALALRRRSSWHDFAVFILAGNPIHSDPCQLFRSEKSSILWAAITLEIEIARSKRSLRSRKLLRST